MLVNGLTQFIPPNFADGGTMTGDLTITGDLLVQGQGTLSFDEVLEGTKVVDVTDTEAFLVRKIVMAGMYSQLILLIQKLLLLQ